jgi:hypothetical protein
LIHELVNNPTKGTNILVKDFKFGLVNDFWDDFIYAHIISNALDQICDLTINLAIDKYSEIDHLLFRLYLRRDEDPIRFRRAFWNINSYGLHLAKKFQDQSDTNIDIHKSIRSDGKYTIAFVFKGGFHLAHSEFFESFLIGSRFFSDQVQVTLILIDEKPDKFNNKIFDHINVFSLSKYRKTSDKLLFYKSFVSQNNFDHISWVACVQNLALYMGTRSALSQSYWSMKYHSIIMDSLDKYAGLGFGGESFVFDDVEWFRGRAFPVLELPKINNTDKLRIKSKYGIPKDKMLLGCSVRTEKLNSKKYWDLIHHLLRSNENIHFAIAAQELPNISSSYINLSCFKDRFHFVGWINTKEWCQCLDLYLDSFPRGSCLTALEAIKASVPLVMFDSEHNRESSALPYLTSVSQLESGMPPGVMSHDEPIQSLISYISDLLNNPISMKNLAKSQSKLLQKLEGKSILYAKDYLNYFLDSGLTIKKTSK